jgi:LIVCS family branched-chain amino acid:cation transporter
MKTNGLVVTIGFALFAMFFGSGNLVFPIAVGQESQGHYWMSALGIVLTGVIVPFLGVLGMMLFKGDINQFFKCFGTKGTFIFSLCALALMGPFGVLARCLTVMHGALMLLFPEISLPLTSLVICVVIFMLTVNKSQIVTILGSMLTPFLLLSIAAIAFFGLYYGEMPKSLGENSFSAFKNGFFQGYQTMDLLAAFFFSTFVIVHLQKKFAGEENQEALALKVFVKSAFIGAGILSSVYLALVVLGWKYEAILNGQLPQKMLGIIAMESLGPYAAPCICVAVVLACLTTGIVLTSLFADFLRKEVVRDKIGNGLSLLITLGIGFAVSTLDFAGIAKFLGPILEATYPALIVLTMFNIANQLWGVRTSHWPVTATLAAKLFWV